MTLSARFFATAAILALIGMAWGIQMSATHDHALSPAHGHLNLVGFVAMSIYGAFYGLFPAAADSRLAGFHYWLALAAVLVLTPGIAIAIAREQPALAQIGSLLTMASMALFVWIVLRTGARVRAGTTERQQAGRDLAPAE